MPLWALLLFATIAYIVIFTDDVYVAKIPLKLYMVGATLGVWFFYRDRDLSLRDYPLAMGVLTLGVVAPVFWALIAGVRAGIGDSVGSHDLTYVLQHASRFGYLLLYFPLVDLYRADRRAGLVAWIAPVLILCGATVAILIVHLATGNEYGTMSVGVFKGVIGNYTEGFRVFIGNQIVLITAMAYTIGAVAARGLNIPRVALALAIVLTAYISHTRGIWLGLSAVCATAVLLLLLHDISDARRRVTLWIVGSGVLLIGGVGIALLSGVHIPGFLGDASASSRVDQAPELAAAWIHHPVLGDGLGATLSSGFERSVENPWSFELTYLQVLFQMGIVGLFVLLAVPGWAIWRSALGVVDRARKPLSGDVAAAAGLVGILVASATNPYLFSSFGMLSLAVLLTLGATAALDARAAPPISD